MSRKIPGRTEAVFDFIEDFTATKRVVDPAKPETEIIFEDWQRTRLAWSQVIVATMRDFIGDREGMITFTPTPRRRARGKQ